MNELQAIARAFSIPFFKVLDAYNKIKTPPMTKIEKWAYAIRAHEGWYNTSRSYRNNSPGNVKYHESGYLAKYGNVRKDDAGFAIFPTYEQGWLYLINSLSQWCRVGGAGGRYYPNMTIRQWAYAYCEDDPTTAHDDREVYALVVAKDLGVSADTQIKNLIT